MYVEIYAENVVRIGVENTRLTDFSDTYARASWGLTKMSGYWIGNRLRIHTSGALGSGSGGKSVAQSAARTRLPRPGRLGQVNKPTS